MYSLLKLAATTSVGYKSNYGTKVMRWFGSVYVRVSSFGGLCGFTLEVALGYYAPRRLTLKPWLPLTYEFPGPQSRNWVGRLFTNP